MTEKQAARDAAIEAIRLKVRHAAINGRTDELILITKEASLLLSRIDAGEAFGRADAIEEFVEMFDTSNSFTIHGRKWVINKSEVEGIRAAKFQNGDYASELFNSVAEAYSWIKEGAVKAEMLKEAKGDEN